MSRELQILIAVAAVVVAVTVGFAIVLAVRLVRTRRRLRASGLPVQNRWVFWAAMIYLVLPTDLVPDPVYLDDIGVLMLALRSMRSSEGKLQYALRSRGGKGELPRSSKAWPRPTEAPPTRH
ncbi:MULTISPECIES: YkvA family protein [unclassified Streptomyces]|uniref:YkvA family protein n=1 Tax=unclassified Streptomyces TaxID=2593676 RepID=UPI0005A83585|nr:YkvA family protein [Streptomyces sp. NBC_00370]